MYIIDKKITTDALKNSAEYLLGDLIKAVVDIDEKILAVDAELHADIESFLLQNGSKQRNLWGINIYPDMNKLDFVEFDSMINIRPSQGNRCRGVKDKNIQKEIIDIVFEKIEHNDS